MATAFQVTVDCTDPARLVRFWATALGYEVEAPPDGAPTWRAYWRSRGVPEDELGDGDCADSVIDPDGAGPRLWFQPVPEGKVVKNRLHLDLAVSGGRSTPLETRTTRVNAEVRRLEGAGATTQRVMSFPDQGSYAVLMHDPEGNEFCLH